MTPGETLNTSAFWRALLPQLTLTEERALLPGGEPVAGMDLERQRFARDGYFSLPGVLDRDRIASLRAAVDILRDNGIPPVFLVLYDVFWDLVAELHGTTKTLIGDYRVFPRIWVWYLDPKEEDAGWPPHREHLIEGEWDPEHPVHSLGLWISLTDVTVDNGPIYVLPATRDPGIPRDITLGLEDFRSFRAMPVPAASVIGWHQSVLHWGGRANVWASGPRISLGWEVAPQRGPEWPVDETWTQCRPPFHRRLRLAAAQLIQYDKFHTLSKAWLDSAADILATVPRGE